MQPRSRMFAFSLMLACWAFTTNIKATNEVEQWSIDNVNSDEMSVAYQHSADSVKTHAMNPQKLTLLRLKDIIGSAVLASAVQMCGVDGVREKLIDSLDIWEPTADDYQTKFLNFIGLGRYHECSSLMEGFQLPISSEKDIYSVARCQTQEDLYSSGKPASKLIKQGKALSDFFLFSQFCGADKTPGDRFTESNFRGFVDAELLRFKTLILESYSCRNIKECYPFVFEEIGRELERKIKFVSDAIIPVFGPNHGAQKEQYDALVAWRQDRFDNVLKRHSELQRASDDFLFFNRSTGIEISNYLLKAEWNMIIAASVADIFIHNSNKIMSSMRARPLFRRPLLDMMMGGCHRNKFGEKDCQQIR